MAVTTKVQDIVTGALNRSSKNSPSIIANNAVELVETVRRATAGIYTFAARINPTFFAETSDVNSTGGAKWARPDLAESVFRIEKTADGAEVVVVPFDDRAAEPGKPAVYTFGQVYRSAGNPLDPVVADSLTFFYAKKPVRPATLADTLDPLWNESYNDLLISEVAVYLALKDGRMDEVESLRADRDRWATLFAAFLEHETIGERRRFGPVQRVTGQTIVPLTSLLAGGATLPGASA